MEITKPVIIVGAGGHAKVVADIFEEMKTPLAGFLDEYTALTTLLNYPVFQKLENLNAYIFFIAIGASVHRQRLNNMYPLFATALHPAARISRHSSVGAGTTVMANATINPASHIGRHCIINTNASVDHDCVLEDYVHLSPNATLCGGVTVGEGTHLGAGSVVIPGIKIGRWCTIGAGTVIIKNIPDGATVVGNPGRIIKQNQLQPDV